LPRGLGGFLSSVRVKRAGLHLAERLFDKLFLASALYVANDLDHAVFVATTYDREFEQILLR